MQAKSTAEMSLLSLAAHRVALLQLHLGSDHYVERTLCTIVEQGQVGLHFANSRLDLCMCVFGILI